MINSAQKVERDEVLYAFHQSCTSPTVEDIIEWVNKYPQFADDIRTHAAITRDWLAREETSNEEVDQVTLDRAFSRALNIAYEAGQRSSTSNDSTAQSFQQLMAACNKDIPAIASEIGVTHGMKRSILADLVNGRMRPPIGKRFTAAVMKALSIPIEAFDSAVQMAINAPRIGHAKAVAIQEVKLLSYEEIIKNSALAPEQKDYWLEGD
jgi:hypothetical protein